MEVRTARCRLDELNCSRIPFMHNRKYRPRPGGKTQVLAAYRSLTERKPCIRVRWLIQSASGGSPIFRMGPLLRGSSPGRLLSNGPVGRASRRFALRIWGSVDRSRARTYSESRRARQSVLTASVLFSSRPLR